MPRRKKTCVPQETLLELISLPREMPLLRQWKARWHTFRCSKCRESVQAIRRQCEAYFRPQPEITSSLLSVYARLQRDETLILKGWKLGEIQSVGSAWGNRWLREGWLFRGGVSVAIVVLLLAILVGQFPSVKPAPRVAEASKSSTSKVPLAQIRIEDRNVIKVHYVEPELLQSMEFQTTSVR